MYVVAKKFTRTYDIIMFFNFINTDIEIHNVLVIYRDLLQNQLRKMLEKEKLGPNNRIQSKGW